MRVGDGLYLAWNGSDERCQRDAQVALFQLPEMRRAWSTLTRSLRTQGQGNVREKLEVLERRLRLLHGRLTDADWNYRIAVGLAPGCRPRSARVWQALIPEQGMRLELTSISRIRTSAIQDYPWVGAHFVVSGEVAIRRYNRGRMFARPAFHELLPHSWSHLGGGLAMPFTWEDGVVHQLLALSEHAMVLSIGLETPVPRMRYCPLQAMGGFDDTLLVDGSRFQ